MPKLPHTGQCSGAKPPLGNPVSVYPVPESPLYPKVSGTFTQEGTTRHLKTSGRLHRGWRSGWDGEGEADGEEFTAKNIVSFSYSWNHLHRKFRRNDKHVRNKHRNGEFVFSSFFLKAGTYTLAPTGSDNVLCIIKEGLNIISSGGGSSTFTISSDKNPKYKDLYSGNRNHASTCFFTLNSNSALSPPPTNPLRNHPHRPVPAGGWIMREWGR